MVEHEKGYTVVEVLVAIVILFLIVTPSTYVVSKIMVGSNVQERRTANSLAIQFMETSLIEKNFTVYRGEEMISGRIYEVKRTINQRSDNTALITISILRRTKELVALHRTVDITQATQ